MRKNSELTRAQVRARSRHTREIKGPMRYASPVGADGRIFEASAEAIVEQWKKQQMGCTNCGKLNKNGSGGFKFYLHHTHAVCDDCYRSLRNWRR